jgi:hypothetical protein
MYRLCLALVAMMLLQPTAAHAQKTDDQLWLAANATTVTGKTTLTIETNGRFSDAAAGFSHTEIGGFVSVPVAKGIDLAFGYRHVADFDHGHALPNEERTRQMITVALGAGFAGRLRFEQRFNSSGGAVGLRLRPQLRLTHPIAANGLALFAVHESFVNFNTTGWGQRGGYERMRNTLGVSIPLSRSIRAEPGYLNQYRFGRDGARDQMDHVATVALNYSF